MATWSLFPEGKLFPAIYATVVGGIVLSTLFVHSTIKSSSSLAAGSDSLALSSLLPLLGSDIASTANGNGLSDRSRNVTADIPPAAVNKASQPRDMFTRSIWDAPVGTEMPDLKSFQLTKEMMEHRAKDNVIIVTFGNYAFLDFILNWVKHLTDLNVFNLLVGAMDVKLMEALYWKGIPVFDMGGDGDTTDFGWGTSKFHKLGREKVLLINHLLTFDYEFLLTDSDVVWLKNPLPYLASFPEADILTSSDQVEPTVTDDTLEVWHEVKKDYNIGIFHWRPTDTAKRLAKMWMDLLVVNDNLWDQDGFNYLVRKVLGPPVGESGLVYAFDGTLKFGILPASIFCSGHTFFVQAMYQQLRLEPYVVHTTFQYSHTEGKRHRLREAMLFYDQLAYYDSPGGFLTFKPKIPKSLLLNGPHTLESHFSLVNYQLKQIRTALAIASLLNRTLVMPPLWCRFDRLWFAHPGILNGTMTRQPFLCPMDHVFKFTTLLQERIIPRDDIFGILQRTSYLDLI